MVLAQAARDSRFLPARTPEHMFPLQEQYEEQGEVAFREDSRSDPRVDHASSLDQPRLETYHEPRGPLNLDYFRPFSPDFMGLDTDALDLSQFDASLLDFQPFDDWQNSTTQQDDGVF